MVAHKYRRSSRERPADITELTVQGAAYGGRMVARESDGCVVFIQGGAPDERLRAAILTRKQRFAEAQALSIVSVAPCRVQPPCEFFGENGLNRGAVPADRALLGPRGACGGCQYQHIDYAAQLVLKQNVVRDLMHRQGRLPHLNVLPTIPSPNPWHYRNRARWIIDEEGKPAYHQAASERLLAVSSCQIVQPRIAEALNHLAGEAWRLPLRTLVAAVTARTAVPWDADDPSAPELILVLHPQPSAKRRDLRLFAGDLGVALPALGGVVQATERSTSSLWAVSHFDARFHGYRFRLDPLTFFQVNQPTAELLVDHVLEQLGDIAGRTILDIYAGAGTFALPVAAHAEQVLVLESDPSAVADAQASARLNGQSNVHVLPGDAADELNGLPRRAADAAILDPPRAGLDEQVISELARIEVPRLVYVSCDPATLARDLQRLATEGYVAESVQPIDLFPQTFHIECVTVLNRR